MTESLGRSPGSPPTSSAGITPTGLSGAVVLSVALRRNATNFLLNDLEPASADGIGPTLDEGLFFSGHPPSRRESSVEQLHQSRVSVRRIRSAMRTFENLFDTNSTYSFRGDLTWYGGVLGELRDLEVMRANLIEFLDSLGDLELTIMVSARVDDAIGDAVERRLDARKTASYQRLVGEMADLEHTMRFSARAFDVAPRVLRRGLKTAWKAVDDRYESADREPTMERLHRLRIALKRLQYAAEITALVDQGPVRRLAKGAQALQTKLGRVHDESVARSWIGRLEDIDAPRRKGLMDLSELHQLAQRQALRGWRGDMRHLDRLWRNVADRKKV